MVRLAALAHHKLQDIRDFSFEEFSAYLVSIGEKPFRAGQVFEWIYKKDASAFEDMTTLSQPLRARLAADLKFTPAVIADQQKSEDGTAKFLFELSDGQHVEAVLIPTAARTTACISTQVGCKFGCRFCASGVAGWKRNLSTAEIMTQVLYVKHAAGKKRPLTHIVFMGIGEPMDNYDVLLKSIHLINSDKAVNIAARRITVSTSGVVPKILKLAEQDLQIELAISLHGYDNPSRDVLMPVNKKYPIEELIAVCRAYGASKRRQITFEYILIKGVTVTPQAPAALKKLFKGLLCKMNLIPYNPVAEFPHQCPSHAEMLAFRLELEKAGIHATIRTPRGKDVNAACGQLRHAHQGGQTNFDKNG
ncbi:MAG: 23S rRNA (adenine(2503)-C(2))-methyltransferase RlmN [Candidatus Omnitrophota bacterium]|nr:23S rRNA (adenine(2503)-C(2))-methyltransferase RlmN [Candidatus Omnitrophota bacterium]